MKAKDIAEKFVGKIVKCSVTKSSPVLGLAPGQGFEARIVGWKKATSKDPVEYVAVEVMPPGQTKFLLDDLAGSSGYVWTYKPLPKSSYGKKILPEEIVSLPSEQSSPGATIPSYKPKKISEWPHTCKDCGKPAQVFLSQIDCSNPSCKNKFKTHSGLDLFLPKEMQEALKRPQPKLRPGIDKEGFISCPTCKGKAILGSWSMKAGFIAGCAGNHKWGFKPESGDKLNGKKVLTFNGKTFV